MSDTGGGDTGPTATRLRLANARHPLNEPWRYWILRYLGALAEVADFEGTHFGHVEAAIALEALIRDAQDALTQLRERTRRR